MPGSVVSTQADSHAICQTVGTPNLKMQMGLYHMQVMKRNLESKLKRYAPQCGHVQIAGCPERNEQDTGEVRYSLFTDCTIKWGVWDGWDARIVPQARQLMGWDS
jgi:hydroxypyruvate isomerase